MRISGNEPSSVILSQTGSYKSWKVMTKQCLNKIQMNRHICRADWDISVSVIFLKINTLTLTSKHEFYIYNRVYSGSFDILFFKIVLQFIML